MQGKMAVRFGAWALSLIAGLAAFCACGAFSAMSPVFPEHPVLGVVIELLIALLVSFIFKRLCLLGTSRFVRDATVRQFAMEGGRLRDAYMARALHRATLGSIQLASAMGMCMGACVRPRFANIALIGMFFAMGMVVVCVYSGVHWTRYESLPARK